MAELDLSLSDALTDSVPQAGPESLVERDFVAQLETETFDDQVGETVGKTDYVPLLDNDDTRADSGATLENGEQEAHGVQKPGFKLTAGGQSSALRPEPQGEVRPHSLDQQQALATDFLSASMAGYSDPQTSPAQMMDASRREAFSGFSQPGGMAVTLEMGAAPPPAERPPSIAEPQHPSLPAGSEAPKEHSPMLPEPQTPRSPLDLTTGALGDCWPDEAGRMPTDLPFSPSVSTVISRHAGHLAVSPDDPPDSWPSRESTAYAGGDEREGEGADRKQKKKKKRRQKDEGSCEHPESRGHPEAQTQGENAPSTEEFYGRIGPRRDRGDGGWEEQLGKSGGRAKKGKSRKKLPEEWGVTVEPFVPSAAATTQISEEVLMNLGGSVQGNMETPFDMEASQSPWKKEVYPEESLISSPLSQDPFSPTAPSIIPLVLNSELKATAAPFTMPSTTNSAPPPSFPMAPHPSDPFDLLMDTENASLGDSSQAFSPGDDSSMFDYTSSLKEPCVPAMPEGDTSAFSPASQPSPGEVLASAPPLSPSDASWLLNDSNMSSKGDPFDFSDMSAPGHPVTLGLSFDTPSPAPLRSPKTTAQEFQPKEHKDAKSAQKQPKKSRSSSSSSSVKSPTSPGVKNFPPQASPAISPSSPPSGTPGSGLNPTAKPFFPSFAEPMEEPAVVPPVTPVIEVKSDKMEKEENMEKKEEKMEKEEKKEEKKEEMKVEKKEEKKEEKEDKKEEMKVEKKEEEKEEKKEEMKVEKKEERKEKMEEMKVEKKEEKKEEKMEEKKEDGVKKVDLCEPLDKAEQRSVKVEYALSETPTKVEKEVEKDKETEMLKEKEKEAEQVKEKEIKEAEKVKEETETDKVKVTEKQVEKVEEKKEKVQEAEKEDEMKKVEDKLVKTEKVESKTEKVDKVEEKAENKNTEKLLETEMKDDKVKKSPEQQPTPTKLETKTTPEVEDDKKEKVDEVEAKEKEKEAEKPAEKPSQKPTPKSDKEEKQANKKTVEKKDDKKDKTAKPEGGEKAKKAKPAVNGSSATLSRDLATADKKPKPSALAKTRPGAGGSAVAPARRPTSSTTTSTSISDKKTTPAKAPAAATAAPKRPSTTSSSRPASSITTTAARDVRPKTTTEKRPLVPKVGVTTSTSLTAAARNGAATTTASKPVTSGRTATSSRTATSTAARKPLASKTDGKPGEEKKPGSLKTSADATKPKTSTTTTTTTTRSAASTAASRTRTTAAKPAPPSSTAPEKKPMGPRAPRPTSTTTSASRPTARPSTAPAPDIRNTRSKIGSTDNMKHQPGGGKVSSLSQIRGVASRETSQGKVQILNKKVDVSKVTSKCGSKDNIKHKPGGGGVKIESHKVSFREKAQSKVGSMDNVTHSPGGGDVKAEGVQETAEGNGTPLSGPVAPAPGSEPGQAAQENGLKEGAACESEGLQEPQVLDSRIPETN